MGFASFGAGDTIFKQGDVGQHFYIILSGAVDVSVYGDEDPKVRQTVTVHLSIVTVYCHAADALLMLSCSTFQAPKLEICSSRSCLA